MAPTRQRSIAAGVGIVGFALLTALGAQVYVPLPQTPVPITLQTLVVMLAGITLGPRLGFASMVFYLLLGTAGYAVFAEARWGFGAILGATGGYLLGFALCQPLIGWCTRRANATWRDLIGANLVGHAVVFACGLAWLKIFLGVGWGEAVQLGLVPFLPGCALKVVLGVLIGKAVLPAARYWWPGRLEAAGR